RRHARRARLRAAPDLHGEVRLMNAVDGNAIAGPLYEAFGREMTTAMAVCGTCGARGVLAEFAVYARVMGDVVRCRSCGSVVLGLVPVRGFTCVHLEGLAALEPAPA